MISLALEKRAVADASRWGAWGAFAASVETAASGVSVNPQKAMTLSALWACVSKRAETIGCLPLSVYEHVSREEVREATEHPLYQVLHNRWNEYTPSLIGRETQQAHCDTWGNGSSEIVKNGLGDVTALYNVTPNRITPKVDANGRRYFEWIDDNGNPKPISPDRILHLPGLSFDAMCGYSPTKVHKEAIGLGLATEKFGATFFGNGVRPGGVFKHPGKMSDPGHARLQQSLMEEHGGPDKAHRVIILEEGMDWQAQGMSPENAQFLETRQFQRVDVCIIFKVPPPLIGDFTHGTYNNSEQAGIWFAQHTISPICTRWEQVMNWQLFRPTERGRFFVKFNLDALLRGDFLSRTQALKEQFQSGKLSLNEWRRIDDMNPIDDPAADLHFVQAQMIPISMAASGAAMNKAQAPKDNQQNARAGVIDAHRKMLASTMGRMARKEQMAAVRAVKKPADFAGWADKFFADHVSTVRDAFGPVFDSLAESLAALSGVPADLVKAAKATAGAATAYCETARADAVHPDVLGEEARLDDLAAVAVGGLVKMLERELKP